MKGEFNMPFGKDRSHFSKNMQNKLDNYQLLLKDRDVNFYNKSYKDFEFSEYDLLLLDPLTLTLAQLTTKTRDGVTRKILNFLKR